MEHLIGYKYVPIGNTHLFAGRNLEVSLEPHLAKCRYLQRKFDLLWAVPNNFRKGDNIGLGHKWL